MYKCAFALKTVQCANVHSCTTSLAKSNHKYLKIVHFPQALFETKENLKLFHIYFGNTFLINPNAAVLKQRDFKRGVYFNL